MFIGGINHLFSAGFFFFYLGLGGRNAYTGTKLDILLIL